MIFKFYKITTISIKKIQQPNNIINFSLKKYSIIFLLKKKIRMIFL